METCKAAATPMSTNCYLGVDEAGPDEVGPNTGG